MKRLILLLLSMALFLPLAAEEKERSNPHLYDFNEFMLNLLPGTVFPHFFLENYAPDATLMIEENNGFSHLDNPRIYFEGEPFTKFNWYYNGFNVNSALDPGRAAMIFPFSTYSGYSLKGQSALSPNPGLHILSSGRRGNYAKGRISSVFANLGSYTALGPIMIQPEHPSLRDEMLYYTRRGIDSSYYFDFLVNRTLAGGDLSLAVDHYFIKRNFNDFNYFEKQFRENGKYLVLSLKYSKDTRLGRMEFLSGISTLDRDHEFSELGRLPQETVRSSNKTIFSGFTFENRSFSFRGSYLHENSDKDPVVPNHSIDIFDNDGDDILAVNRTGTFSSDVFSGEFIHRLLKEDETDLEWYLDLRYSRLHSDEIADNFNSVYADHDPYQVILWEPGDTYSSSNLNVAGGLRFTRRFGKSLITARAYINHSGLTFRQDENNIRFNGFGFDLGFRTEGKTYSVYLSGGRKPEVFRENMNVFMDRSGLSGTIWYWSDINDDGVYQPGEESSVYGYTGPTYHYLDDGFENPFSNSIVLLYTKKISRNFNFNLKALYKQFRNTPWVGFDEGSGYYQQVDGRELYFISTPVDRYTLTNYSFEKDPFYAQLLLNFSGKITNKWFFSFSFMAHMGMGYTAFGNGPNSNDLGILNESMANPNSWINGYGRLDGDRGFVSKVYFGYFLSRDLFLGVSLKYRDGNPFAFLDSYYGNEQWILNYNTIQAEDERGIKGGPREDYVSDVNLKLNYQFRLFRKKAVLGLSLFNILDFGSELSEYVFSGGERYSMEMQIPKSIRLTLSFEL